MDKLDDLRNLKAIKQQYISKDHQKVMDLAGNGEVSVDTRLTKGNVTPPAASSPDNTDISALTGETRESKAKAYVAEVSKKVASQYVGTITTMSSKLASNDDKMEAMEKKLELAMASLKKATRTVEIIKMINLTYPVF